MLINTTEIERICKRCDKFKIAHLMNSSVLIYERIQVAELKRLGRGLVYEVVFDPSKRYEHCCFYCLLEIGEELPKDIWDEILKQSNYQNKKPIIILRNYIKVMQYEENKSL